MARSGARFGDRSGVSWPERISSTSTFDSSFLPPAVAILPSSRNWVRGWEADRPTIPPPFRPSQLGAA
jgi:hypothetical protein